MRIAAALDISDVYVRYPSQTLTLLIAKQYIQILRNLQIGLLRKESYLSVVTYPELIHVLYIIGVITRSLHGPRELLHIYYIVNVILAM